MTGALTAAVFMQFGEWPDYRKRDGRTSDKPLPPILALTKP